MLSLRQKTVLFVLIGSLLLSGLSCGGGSAVYLGTADGDGPGVNGETGGEASGEGEGVFGATTVTSSSDHYDLIVTVGEAAPIGYIESDTGVYEIISPMVF